MEIKNFNRRYKRIVSSINDLITREKKALDEYFSEFTDERLVEFSESSDEDKAAFVESYYSCAEQITECFNEISSMSARIYKLTNDAHAIESEEAKKKSLRVFEAVTNLSRATQHFLSHSDTIISDDRTFSYSKLHMLTISFHTTLNEIASSLTD